MRSIAAIAMITLALVLAGGGNVLVRLDQLRAEDRALAAQLRLEAARRELAIAIVRRDLKPDNQVEVLTRRTDALRGAILGLVRTGKVALVGDPGGEWALWPVELAEVPR